MTIYLVRSGYSEYQRTPYVPLHEIRFSDYRVMPDANGLGKPDILMGKRVVDWPETGRR